jgi:hypothetical protein
MAVPNLNFSTNRGSGWTAATITPDTDLHSAADTSLDVNAPVRMPDEVLNAPITPDTLRTTPQSLGDPTLGSRQFMSLPAGFAQPVARTSVYETPEAPAFLADAVARLNATQSGRATAQQSLIQQLLGAVGGGGPNAYLLAPALTAAVGATGGGGGGVSFGPIQNPLIGQGYAQLAAAQAERARAQTSAVNRVQTLQDQILGLQQQQRSRPQSSTFSWGGGGNSVSNQIFDLQQQLANAQKIGTAAASSGWGSMAIPGY